MAAQADAAGRQDRPLLLWEDSRIDEGRLFLGHGGRPGRGGLPAKRDRVSPPPRRDSGRGGRRPIPSVRARMGHRPFGWDALFQPRTSGLGGIGRDAAGGNADPGGLLPPDVGRPLPYGRNRDLPERHPPVPPDPPIGPNAILLVNESVLVDYKIDFPGKIHSLGSTAAHICYIMRGSAVGAIGQAHIWDYAACAAMLRVLNVPFRFLSGAAVEFANLYDGRRVPEPTLVCPAGRFDTVKRILEAGSPG